MCLEFDPYEEGAFGRERGVYPLPLSESVRVLALLFDRSFSLGDHFCRMTHRAQGRQGVMSRVAKARWGLETGVLRMTLSAVIVSLIRYGLTVLGNCLPPDMMANMETVIMHPAARRVGGLDRSARIEDLHFPAGTSSCKNLYVRQCAGMLDSILRAPRCSAAKRLEKVRQIEYVGISLLLEEFRNKNAAPSARPSTKWYIH